MSVKEGCFILGVALLRISRASELASWAANKKRFDEAGDFLSFASLDISRALAANYITAEQAEAMRSCIEGYEEAIAVGKTSEAQDSLAELSGVSDDITFQKVVECECGK